VDGVPDRPESERPDPDAAPTDAQPDLPRPVTAPLQEITITIGFGLMTVGTLVALVIDPSWWRAVTVLCFAATIPVARAAVRSRVAPGAPGVPPARHLRGTLLPLAALALVALGLWSVRLAA
jgi:hypothetical protein